MRNVRRLVGPAVLIAGVIALVSTSVVAEQRLLSPGVAESVGLKRATEKRFTAAQMANLEERIATANRILDRLGSEAGKQGNLSVWRRANMELLLGLSLAALQQVERNANSVDSFAATVGAAGEDPNLIGDPNQDLVYFPITPCRYVDTRGAAPVSPAAPRSYDLANNGAIYGGSAACTLPQTVTAAIAANITITEPQGAPAFLAVNPTLAAPTTSWMNWYESGPSVQAANAGVFSVFQGAGAEFHILVSSPTHVLVDFFGFFAEPNATAVDNFVTFTTELVAASSTFSIVSPPCPAGYRLTGGGHIASLYGAVLTLDHSGPTATGANTATAWHIQGTNGVNAQNYTSYGVCARIPGR